MMGKVLCFGELLLRISPDNNGTWLQENKLPFFVGGAEANVAAALALWEVPVGYFSALPDNYLSHKLVQYLKELGIDTEPVHYHGERIGLYFLPEQGELKSAQVIYDRANSAFATLDPDTVDWNAVFKGVSVLHFSAICPAVSAMAAKLCEAALRAAREKGISVSVDLNYRAKLWQYGVDPQNVMPGLVQHCELVMGNIWAAEKMLGIPVPDNVNTTDSKALYLAQAAATSQAIIAQYPACKMVANTFRFETGTGLKYYTTLYTNGVLYSSAEYTASHVVNKIGSGDCFMAGLLYGRHNGLTPQETVDFATAAAFRKLFTGGDFSTAGADEIRLNMKQHG